MTTNPTSAPSTDEPVDPATDQPQGAPESLRRPVRGRIVAGVAAAVANYLCIDVAIVRVGLVVLCLIGGLGIPAYIAGWVLIPEEGGDESLAEAWLGPRHEHDYLGSRTF